MIHNVRITLGLNFLASSFFSLIFLTQTVQATENKKGTLASKPIKIVTSFTVLAGLAQEILGAQATIESLTRFHQDPHHFEPSIRDISTLRSADLILINGLQFEPWFERLVAAQGLESKILTLSDFISPLPVRRAESSGRDFGRDFFKEPIREPTHETGTHQHGLMDPHAWLSPKNAKLYAQGLRKRLMSFTELNQTLLDQNLFHFEKRVDKLIEKIAKVKKDLSLSPSKQGILASHDSLQYLAEDMGLKIYPLHSYNLADLNNAKNSLELLTLIKEKKIKVAFLESSVKSRFFDRLVQEEKLRVGPPLYTDSIDFHSTPLPAVSQANSAPQNLSELLDHNIKSILQTLAD